MLAPVLKTESERTSRPYGFVQRAVRKNKRAQGFEPLIQRILKDRTGRKTWKDLERLEQRCEHDPKARRALRRLDALHSAEEYREAVLAKDPQLDPAGTAYAIDSSDRKTQFESWSRAFRGLESRDKLELLRHSNGRTGWSVLGLPACFEKKVGPSSSVDLGSREEWNRLIAERLEEQISDTSHDPKVLEYQRLYHAYRRLQTAKLDGKVSERSLYLDMKSLEEQLLPEHLDRARRKVKSRLLGNDEHEPIHPQSRVRRFLGALTAVPSAGRESYLFRELSEVAVSKPEELGCYASLVLAEIRRCPKPFAHKLLPKFQKALAQVGRVYSDRINKTPHDRTNDFRHLLLAITGTAPGEDAEQTASLEYYRSGLTVNGTTRNYTYT